MRSQYGGFFAVDSFRFILLGFCWVLFSHPELCCVCFVFVYVTIKVAKFYVMSICSTFVKL